MFKNTTLHRRPPVAAFEKYSSKLSCIYKWLKTCFISSFSFIYSWLEIIDLHTKKSLNNLYSNRIGLIGVNSVAEQGMKSFPKEFLELMWTNWNTHTHTHTHTHARTHAHAHTHTCSHTDQRNTQINVSILVLWVFWCSLYKSYLLQIYFRKRKWTLQRHPFFNFSFKNT